MTGKELLNHPFIDKAGMAAMMYPDREKPFHYLIDKLYDRHGETFNKEDDEKAIEVFGLLIRKLMLSPDIRMGAKDIDLYNRDN